MSKIRLQSKRVMFGIGQGEAAGMAQHMRMRLEIEAGSDAGPLDHFGLEPGEKDLSFWAKKLLKHATWSQILVAHGGYAAISALIR